MSAAPAVPTLKLASGAEIPVIGFGCAFGNWTDPKTFMGFTPEESWAPLQKALRAGMRHFDTAYIYGTHRHLGITLGQQFASGALKRSDVFITTKVFHPPVPIALKHLCFDMTNPEVDVKKTTVEHFERSLDDLGMGYVDLLLMHWPGQWGSSDAVLNRRLRKECWEVFETLLESGKARAIGVSNFEKHHLEQLIADTKVVPMVNQIEVSPFLQRHELHQFCKEKGIVIEAWAPFGSGATGVLADPAINEIAKKSGKSVGQVILRWLVQQGMVALPKSSSEERMRENLQIFDFELSAEHMAQLDGMNQNKSSVGHQGSIA